MGEATYPARSRAGLCGGRDRARCTVADLPPIAAPRGGTGCRPARTAGLRGGEGEPTGTTTGKEARVSLQARLQSLKGRHAILEDRIEDEDGRPRPDDTVLSRLKQQKLRLKEEMERISA